MTQPDGFVPDQFTPGASGATGAPGFTGVVSETGLAALASYTQTDWENQIEGGFSDRVGPLEGLFGIITEGFLTVAEAIVGLFSEFVDLDGFINTLNDILQFFYNLLDRTGFFDVIDAVSKFFGWLFDLFGDAVTAVGGFLEPVFEWLAWLWELFGDSVEDLLEPLFDFLKWFIETFGDVIEAVMKPLFLVLKAIIEVVGEVVLKNFFDFIAWFFDLITIESFEEFLDDIFNFFTDILNPERFVEIFKAIFKFLADIFAALNLQGILDLLTGLFGWLINWFFNTVDAGAATLATLFDGLKSFLARVPVVGELLGLAGQGAQVNGRPVARISDLVEWFQQNVLTTSSQIPATNLIGTIPARLLGSLGVGNVDNTTPNQVNLNSFPQASVMQQGGRWAWDGAVSRTPDSGSARVTCNAAQAYMYSNKIPVAAGQLLSLSAWLRWSGVSNSSVLSSPISIGVRTFNSDGSVAQSLTQIASVPTLGFPSNQTTWVEVKNLAAWQVPAGITEVRMAIGVNQSATAGTVWFDDIALRKTNNLAQNLVTDLLPGLNAVIDGLTGNSPGTSQLPSAAAGNLYTAGNAAWQAADTADTNAGLALAGASGAQAAANSAASGASGANTKAQQTIDGVNSRFGNNQAAGQAGTSVATALADFNSWLFGSGSTRPGNSFASGRIPNLDASKLTTGRPGPAVLNNILPTSTSGATISRRNTNNFVHQVARNMFATTQIARSENVNNDRSPFFDTIEYQSSDIQILQRTVNGHLLGIFKTTYAGWYMVELSFRLDPAFTLGFCFAPLLYRTPDLRALVLPSNIGTVPYTPADTRTDGGTGFNLTPYKIGADAPMTAQHPTAVGLTTPHNAPRYAQSSWVVYLPAGGAVAAGYDSRENALGTVDSPIDADGLGIETYFSIAALSKTAS